jgi:hypothetical protein
LRIPNAAATCPWALSASMIAADFGPPTTWMFGFGLIRPEVISVT